ncbi:hypothetical protein A3H10_01005 [Candidatus Uhrbacteria bacterium RIFCSPLOWO2_12_FULL_46_10]|uniref:Uncharacterized protein n=1 Tax=Candidatus Uhrbacteria bacterium RIFCSPLOWO2_01_FULL_47_25 TaxID=1802402 RepID=A0A1F7UWP6_9BACT|nr:MAG: hypothetical protein UX68_C0023G0034 [Parcubacteria group bacterium GW2011_GWA2_46_9]OGL60186.1 MAG: hypothetical protein A2752_00960 [Candidatus Uhrbacteria bacterium RIFCSPHIGHO2_01_FULL_46_23]OGL69650.1 MAG: hypothetical protein A3D60_02930 [Candidatus Uhrbacteria bacterium RIFCSPHIGHO2_02_FULL_47_29]OGL75880.1 MAG: hypothetical protein A3E96_04860 [Candidatus Uhrbacteria bacterium RIFCSPHIGHO2_12_FULL_46_13]OGL82711.1 MAG: hypothetical protein A2936_03945 [Candidatus Uhrbacteria bac
METATGRIIGIRHRVKKTTKGEARPTQVAIDDGKEVSTLTLDDRQAELDFVYGIFPVRWRVVASASDISQVKPHHRRTRRLADDEQVTNFDHELIVYDGKTPRLVTHVPVAYDGLRLGDRVVSILGGSGGTFLHALSNIGERKSLGSTIFGTPPFVLDQARPNRDKDQDNRTLIELFKEDPELFYVVGPRERRVIRVREALIYRKKCQGDRITCSQRLRQRYERSLFLTEEGGYPEGTIEDGYDALKASDQTLKLLVRTEESANDEIAKAVAEVPVWSILKEIIGCGPTIAAGIIAAVGDIRRFQRPGDDGDWRRTANRVKAYLGVHVLQGGQHADVPPDKQFPRKRRGLVANWDETLGRQSLYQLADQWNYRPKSDWGQKLREYKQRLHDKHPTIIEVTGANGRTIKRYTNGHILKMARWRTLTKFVEWLVKQWLKLEVSGTATTKAPVP